MLYIYHCCSKSNLQQSSHIYLLATQPLEIYNTMNRWPPFQLFFPEQSQPSSWRSNGNMLRHKWWLTFHLDIQRSHLKHTMSQTWFSLCHCKHYYINDSSRLKQELSSFWSSWLRKKNYKYKIAVSPTACVMAAVSTETVRNVGQIFIELHFNSWAMCKWPSSHSRSMKMARIDRPYDTSY